MAERRGRSLGRVSIRYGWAVAAIVAAFLLRQLLAALLGPGVPAYVTFYPVVMLVALSSGFAAGAVATLVGAVLSVYWTLAPGHTFSIVDPGEAVGLAMFVFVGLFLAAGSEWHRRARARASEFERQLVIHRGQEALRDVESRIRDEARAQLEREKTVFQAVVNGTRISHLVYLDRDFNFVRVNEAYAASCRYSPDAMIGKNYFELYPDAENQAIFTRVRDTGVSAEFHDRPFVFPDQPERGVTYWDWTLLPVKNESGAVDGLVFALVETTEHRLSERSLLDADRRKNEFLATLSHELRNPLAPIKYALDLLEHESDPEVKTRAVGVIGRQLRHLVRLVDDLLDVTRITNNKLQLRKQHVLLSDIVRQGLEAALPNIERGDHELVVGPFPEDVWMEGDPDRLVQALTNLLNNAAKFTPPKGRIVLRAGATDTEVTVTVADTGLGLSAEDRARVFDMFTQVHDGVQGGLGIGLALVRSTVELHGGSVEVHSDGAGQGSEFTVRLPRAEAPEPMPIAESRADVSGCRKVLVVDDNADAANMMRTLLELHGHEVQVAYDGYSALALAVDLRPDIGLFDIGLPTMDGYELARRIREDPRTRSMFLIAVTGWGQEDDRRRSRGCGFDAHLTKPADHDMIWQLVSKGARG